MKRKIKKCKGFDEKICTDCRRQDNNSQLLVKSLTKNKECQYWIKK